MTAVSDTTTPLYLLRLGEERLLGLLFDSLILPDVVVAELNAKPDEVARLKSLDAVRFYPSLTATLPQLPSGYAHLDAGEYGTLVLASHLGERLVIIDETAGRKAALSLGHEPIGLLGVANLAKQSGAIEKVKPLIDRAVSVGFRVRPSFYASFLRSIGE